MDNLAPKDQAMADFIINEIAGRNKTDWAYKDYKIMVLNLLNRAVDIEIARGRPGDMEHIMATLEELKDIVREQYKMFKGDK